MNKYTFTEGEIDNLRYGDQRFGDFLSFIEAKDPSKYKPIGNLLELTKNIYQAKHGIVTSNNTVHIDKTMPMITNTNSTEEEILAGYILTFSLMIKSSKNLIKSDVPADVQIQILNYCYETACDKSLWVCFQIEHYMHSLKFMHGGMGGLPGRTPDLEEP